MISNLCLYIGLVFFIVAFCFLVGFINTSIRKQLKQLGILSAMGVDRKGMLLIYGSSTGLLCAVTYVLSCIFYAVGNVVLNAYFCDIFQMTVVVSQFHILIPVLLLLALCAVTVAGCVLPVWNYKRKYAADLINRGLIK